MRWERIVDNEGAYFNLESKNCYEKKLFAFSTERPNIIMVLLCNQIKKHKLLYPWKACVNDLRNIILLVNLCDTISKMQINKWQYTEETSKP